MTDKAERTKKITNALATATGIAFMAFPVIGVTTNLLGWTKFSFFELTSYFWALGAYHGFKSAVTEGVSNALVKFKVWEAQMLYQAMGLAENIAPTATAKAEKPKANPFDSVVVPLDFTKKKDD